MQIKAQEHLILGRVHKAQGAQRATGNPVPEFLMQTRMPMGNTKLNMTVALLRRQAGNAIQGGADGGPALHGRQRTDVGSRAALHRAGGRRPGG